MKWTRMTRDYAKPPPLQGGKDHEEEDWANQCTKETTEREYANTCISLKALAKDEGASTSMNPAANKSLRRLQWNNMRSN